MNMTSTDRRALALLQVKGMTCTELGDALWRKPGQRVPCSSQGGNKWTRNAGKVIKRLQAFGLVEMRTPYRCRCEWFAKKKHQP